MPTTADGLVFDEAAGFRETFLLVIRDKEHRDALRSVATLLGDLLIEAGEPWCRHESPAADIGAAAADLRHLQGLMALWGESAEMATRGSEDWRLYGLARRMATKIGKLAAELEAALAAAEPPEPAPEATPEPQP